VVATTTWRGGESSSKSQISKAVTWNGNMKSKKHIQLRSRALEDTHKSRNIQPTAKRYWAEQEKARMDRIYADHIIRPKPTCKTRKGKNETKGVALWN